MRLSPLFLFLVKKSHYALDRKKGSFHLKSNIYLLHDLQSALFKSYIAVYRHFKKYAYEKNYVLNHTQIYERYIGLKRGNKM